MKNRLLFLFLFFCLIRNTSLAQNNNSSQIKAVQLISTYPFSFHEINGEWVYSDTITMFYRNDTIVYRIPHYNSFSYQRINPVIDQEDDDEYLNDSTVTSIGYTYFVYKKGSTKGLWLTDTGRINNKIYDHPDTVMSHNNLNSFIQSYQTIKDSSDLIAIVDSADLRIMKYVNKGHVHKAGNLDTAFIYLGNRFRDIDYSFSDELEKLYNKKIERYRIHAHCDPHSDYSLPSFEMKFDWQLETPSPSIIAEAGRFFAMASRYRQ